MKSYTQVSIFISIIFILTACGGSGSSYTEGNVFSGDSASPASLGSTPPVTKPAETSYPWVYQDSKYGTETLRDFTTSFPKMVDIPQEEKNILKNNFKRSDYFFKDNFNYLYKRKSLLSKVQDTLTVEEFFAIKNYVAGFAPKGEKDPLYISLNRSLRNGEKMSDYVSFVHKSLASGLQHLVENGYVYSSSEATSDDFDKRHKLVTQVDMEHGVTPLFRGAKLPQAPKKGDILAPYAYLSTSKKWYQGIDKFTHGSNSYAIIMFSDQGIPLYKYGLGFEPENTSTSEFEVLIPSDRKPIKVVKVLDATFKGYPIVIAADSDFSNMDYLKDNVDIYWLLDVIYAQSKNDDYKLNRAYKGFKINDTSGAQISAQQYIEDKVEK